MGLEVEGSYYYSSRQLKARNETEGGHKKDTEIIITVAITNLATILRIMDMAVMGLEVEGTVLVLLVPEVKIKVMEEMRAMEIKDMEEIISEDNQTAITLVDMATNLTDIITRDLTTNPTDITRQTKDTAVTVQVDGKKGAMEINTLQNLGASTEVMEVLRILEVLMALVAAIVKLLEVMEVEVMGASVVAIIKLSEVLET